jgi:tetratricopeptide (TPR) repeat protein
MSLLARLIGATPEKKEQKGDRLQAAGRWGEAKLVYESALAALAQRLNEKSAQVSRLETKIRETRNALAREHRKSADNMIEGGYWEEAREMLALAIEVSADQDDRRQLERKRRELESRWMPETQPALHADFQDDLSNMSPDDTNEDYFLALCHTLPDNVRRAYQGYGDDFKRGYLALNQGNFETAAQYLELAHRNAPHPDSHIPLELATAYLNLNRQIEAHDLLVTYQRQYPEALPAYQLLCEIYWDQENFDQASALLNNLPPDLSASLAAAALRGETLERAGQRQAARDHYRQFLEIFGWETRMAHKLARICRDLGATDEAHQLYRQIIESCHSCRPGINPQIKHEYAELLFEKGQHDAKLLEQYLSLAREVPKHAALYYSRVAHIYARQGYEHEARRFQKLARQLDASANHSDGKDAEP